MISFLGNLTLLSLGISVAAIGILGFAVFFNNKKSATNQAFLAFALATIVWGVSNYLNYQFTLPNAILWALRINLCISTLHAFFFFNLAYVFPREKIDFRPVYKFILIPIVILVACLTLTPFVFTGIGKIAPAGQVSNPDRGDGIIVFAITAVLLVAAGIFLFFKKWFRAAEMEKAQYLFVVIGTILTFVLILTFNLILPIFFNQLSFAPLGAAFLFPFIAFTAYAIFKHHLLSVKVISTEILAFILSVVTLSEVAISQNLAETLFRSGEFVLVLIFSIFLIQSVLREVEQRAQLEELSHFKSELLSLASHQIKSPLAAIKGFASLIADGSYGKIEDKTKEAIIKIQHSADDLIGLINTLLDVRKVEEGKMEYKFERIDLADMIAKIVDLLQPLAGAKQLALAFGAQQKPVWVNADPEKLKQVVQNLVDNAIKYTPSGFIKVQLSTAGSIATVSVSDSGLGIPANLVPHLFEEFVRDERVKKEILGTGLGLYIARKIIEAHGGKIWAESSGEGKGSTFAISIPQIN